MTPGLSGDCTGFVPGTSSVKIWDNPGFLLILHSGVPANPGLSLGLSLGQTRGRAAQKVYVKKKFLCLFRSLKLERGRRCASDLY